MGCGGTSEVGGEVGGEANVGGVGGGAGVAVGAALGAAGKAGEVVGAVVVGVLNVDVFPRYFVIAAAIIEESFSRCASVKPMVAVLSAIEKTVGFIKFGVDTGGCAE